MSDNSPSTLGAEFEGVIGSRDEISAKLGIGSSRNSNKYYSSVTRDASVESFTTNIGMTSKLFLGNSLLRNSFARRNDSVSGYEIVTNPLPMSDMRKVIENVISTQVQLGEIFSERSSIHLHVGFPRGFIFYKTAVALALRVEPLLFKIAGMGRPYRGQSNNSAYARPMASPPAVKLSDSNMVAILSPQSAIEADTEHKFWNRYGGIRAGDRDRYNPLRYFATNVFSTQLRGTMEFRMFNFCSSSKFVEGCASLVRMLADLMIRIDIPTAQQITELSIFDENDNSEYIDLLYEIIALSKYYNSEFPMEARDVEAVLDIIRTTPQPLFSRDVILSHIKSPRITLGEAKEFGLTVMHESKAKEPGIVDIHTFNNSSRTLIGA